MIIGFMDRKIEVYTYTTTRSAAGQEIKTRVLFATVYAQVEYLPSAEILAADKKAIKQKAQLNIRYLSGLVEQMQIKLDSKFFEIISIQPQGRNESMIVQIQIVE